ncbi:Serpentine Receptor, class H [Caenorhabditis elegans]|uniref:Serpentine Receptor, class H n=1 Tax=Caenorhabditis elegans TaxID=6239 RepID=Q7YXA7_CAEEL|nr:Serpentine Receptor, class H [Caenorhabditis elegans]CAE11310.1 Serpentine Receptor, class H [Caenorhabditis elegans]|eukprot:NP_001024040.1 Serpentine Receptor, class H [Caenorhabditis elegans]
MCSTSLDFLASDEVYSKILHTLTMIEVVTHSLGAYIIISKTPKKLESVKTCMLLLHFVGAFVDVYFSILTMPVLHLPVCGGHPLGVLALLGVPTSLQTYVGISAIGGVIATILIFLDDRRYRLIHGHKTSTTRKWHRLLYVTAQYFLTAAFPAPIFLNLPDQEYGKLMSRNINTCIASDVFNHPNFFLLGLTGKYIVICIVSALSLLHFQILLQIGLIFRQLLKNRPVSRNKNRLQNQYFVAMSIQLVIPIVILAFPVVHIVLSIYLGYHNQGANNLAFIIISLHGVLSTITMLMVHRPYRKSIFEMLHVESYHTAESRERHIWRLQSRRSLHQF